MYKKILLALFGFCATTYCANQTAKTEPDAVAVLTAIKTLVSTNASLDVQTQDVLLKSLGTQLIACADKLSSEPTDSEQEQKDIEAIMTAFLALKSPYEKRRRSLNKELKQEQKQKEKAKQAIALKAVTVH